MLRVFSGDVLFFTETGAFCIEKGVVKLFWRGKYIMDEQIKFLAWHQEESNRGLVDIKFFAGDGCSSKNSNSEDFFREANTVNALFEQGTVVERKDVF